MDWKEILKHNYQNGNDVENFLHLNKEEVQVINQISDEYPMFTNEYYLSLIDPDDPEDPIRKMSIPSAWELEKGGDTDTSGESSNTVLPGMQHKYARTALILSTSKCSMYCRHCFRKRMVGLTDDEIAFQLDNMVQYIKDHPSIDNILISGGDAFLNSNERIAEYLEKFTRLPQLNFIRFGTRTPVVLPQRISEDEELLKILADYSEQKQLYVVTQFNHPRELTKEAVRSIKTLMKLGIVVKNQTVLLKGINDDPKVLGELLTRLAGCGAVPYYIFQCRPVRGVLNHFQVPFEQGYDIVDKAKDLQNGQGKCIRYTLSHPTGKIEIIGKAPTGEMIFKYHQAKDPADAGRIFLQKVTPDQCWL
ncbi:MAG: KamA family radical SAM protein [Lachnospiraceae bacterium]|nr:KamA family radical SAM protein [Lachnospiraceae bacterium]